MRLYRGQKYGEVVGEFWTSSKEDARSYAMSRGGNREWVVLQVEVDARKLRSFLFDSHRGVTTYHVPVSMLAMFHSHAVRVVDGFIDITSRKYLDPDAVSTPTKEGAPC